MFKRVFLFILLLITTSACVSHTTVRHSGNYDSVIARSNRVALILPPEVEVNMIEFGGKKKRAYDYELHLESIIIDELTPALRAEHIQPVFVTRRMLHDQELTMNAGRTRDRYNELREQLYKQIMMKEEKAFDINESVGPMPAEIGIKNKGDLIIIVDFARNVKSSGARTADIMLDLLSNSRRSDEADKSVLILGILEAKTGKFLWSNLTINVRDAISASFDNNTHEDKLMHEKISLMVKSLFKEFNKPKDSGK